MIKIFVDNSLIVLLAIFTHKDDQNITTFQTLQNLLPLEKSHISQTLAHNEKLGLIKKPASNKYFTQIKINPEGIKKAKRYIAFLSKIINQPS